MSVFYREYGPGVHFPWGPLLYIQSIFYMTLEKHAVLNTGFGKRNLTENCLSYFELPGRHSISH